MYNQFILRGLVVVYSMFLLNQYLKNTNACHDPLPHLRGSDLIGWEEPGHTDF